jgi:hypothetical protein
MPHVFWNLWTRQNNSPFNVQRRYLITNTAEIGRPFKGGTEGKHSHFVIAAYRKTIESWPMLTYTADAGYATIKEERNP